MIRLLLLALAVVLTACSIPNRAPDAAYADYLAAVESRDADAAYAHLDAAADAGHLSAMAEQIEAHRRGYVAPPGVDAPNLPVRTPLWRLGRLERRFARALRDSAAAGSPTALLFVSEQITGRLTIVAGEMQTDLAPADRDTVTALYRRLVGSDVARMALANVAWHLGDDDAARRHLDEAVAAAEPGACAFRLWIVSDERPDLGTPAGFADYVDRVGACPRPVGGPDPAADDVRALVAEADGGNDAARAFLADLHQTGVFDRHPRLDALVGN